MREARTRSRARLTDLPLVGKGRTYWMKQKVPSGQWSTLRVVAKDNLFEIYYDGNELYEVKDETFKRAGKSEYVPRLTP